MPYLNCQVALEYDGSLDELADIVSKELLGGIPFIGKEQAIYEQTPAVFAQHEIFGHRVILCAGKKSNIYLLQIRPGQQLIRAIPTEEMGRMGRANIGDFLVYILQAIPGIRCLP